MADFFKIFQKDPEEKKIRGVDLSTWLLQGENITSTTITVEEYTPVQTETLAWAAATQPDTLMATLVKKDVADRPFSFAVSPQYDRAVIQFFDDDTVLDVTGTVLVSGSKVLLGGSTLQGTFEAGTSGVDYRITFEWVTDQGRDERIYMLMQVRRQSKP